MASQDGPVGPGVNAPARKPVLHGFFFPEDRDAVQRELQEDRDAVSAALQQEQGEVDPLSQEFREEVERRLERQWQQGDAAYDEQRPADPDRGGLAREALREAIQLQSPELRELDSHALTVQALDALGLRGTKENPRPFAVTFKGANGHFWSKELFFHATKVAPGGGLYLGSKFASSANLKNPDYRFKRCEPSAALKREIETKKGEWAVTDLYFTPAQFDCPGRGLNDENVISRHVAVAEIDKASLAEQFARYEALPEELQPHLLVFSGGKSIHAFWRCPEGCAWEQIREFQQAMAAVIHGDPAVTSARGQRMRFPWARQLAPSEEGAIGRVQVPLKVRSDAPDLDPQEGVARLEELLAARGVADWRKAFQDLSRKADRDEVARAARGARAGELGRQWAEHSWTPAQLTAANAFRQTVPLLDFVGKGVAELLREGSAPGCRWEDGIKVTLALAGAVSKLEELGVAFTPSVEEVLEEFADASDALIQGAEERGVDRARLQAQFEDALAGGATPGRSVADFLSSLHFHTGGALGEWSKGVGQGQVERQTPLSGNSAEREVLQALGEGWDYNRRDDGEVVRYPSRLASGELSSTLGESLRARLGWDRLRHAPTVDEVPLSPAFLDGLSVALSEAGWVINKNVAIDALLYAARKNGYHPVQRYLERIEADEAILPIDLDTFGRDYLRVSDEQENRWLRLMLLGAVQRVMEPGSDFKLCVVLRSSQQTMLKSKFVETLAGQQWFCDTAAENEKDLLQLIHTCWLYELAELDSITSKKDAGRLKNLISSKKDSFRPPYGRAPEEHLRSSIFIGTCNRGDFLVDDTGNVRFAVVEISQMIDIEAVARDRDQIWKAAVQLYRSGAKPWLNEVDRAAVEARNKNYLAQDPWEELVQKHFMEDQRKEEFKHEPLYKGGFSTAEALEWVGMGVCEKGKLNTGHSRKMAAVLRKLGYEQEQNPTWKEGVKTRRWYPTKGGWAPPEKGVEAKAGGTPDLGAFG